MSGAPLRKVTVRKFASNARLQRGWRSLSGDRPTRSPITGRPRATGDRQPSAPHGGGRRGRLHAARHGLSDGCCACADRYSWFEQALATKSTGPRRGWILFGLSRVAISRDA